MSVSCGPYGCSIPELRVAITHHTGKTTILAVPRNTIPVNGCMQALALRSTDPGWGFGKKKFSFTIYNFENGLTSKHRSPGRSC